MTLDEALDIVVARTQHKRYRELCAEDNPDLKQRDAYRALVIQMANNEPTQFPPIMVQAGNFLGAVGRAIGAFLTGEPVRLADEEADQRWSICLVCDQLEISEDRKDGRCKLCGCAMREKTYWAQEECPILKWHRVESA